MSGSFFEMRGGARAERRLRCLAAAAIAFMLSYPGGAAADNTITTCQTSPNAPIADYTHVFTRHEEEAARNCPTAALLSTIADWLTANFSVPAADDAPRIAFVSPAQLHAMRYGPPRSAPQEGSRNGGPMPGDRAVVAVYEDRTETIYLARGWNQASSADTSVLVHEMVHHLQKRAGLKYTCPEEREKLAYQAQARWLAQAGRSLESEFEVDRFTLLASTTCMM